MWATFPLSLLPLKQASVALAASPSHGKQENLIVVIQGTWHSVWTCGPLPTVPVFVTDMLPQDISIDFCPAGRHSAHNARLRDWHDPP